VTPCEKQVIQHVGRFCPSQVGKTELVLHLNFREIPYVRCWQLVRSGLSCDRRVQFEWVVAMDEELAETIREVHREPAPAERSGENRSPQMGADEVFKNP